jgi:hypothetical protein
MATGLDFTRDGFSSISIETLRNGDQKTVYPLKVSISAYCLVPNMSLYLRSILVIIHPLSSLTGIHTVQSFLVERKES